MPKLEFEPTISVGERRQAYVLDREGTGTGAETKMWNIKSKE
jgi:hypothetical protein